MIRLSPYYTNYLIDMIFRGQVGAPSLFSGVGYFALFTAPPHSETSETYSWIAFDTADEVSYTGYARQSVLSDALTRWRATQGGTSASTGTSGETGPAQNVYFPLCTDSDATVTHLGLCYYNDPGDAEVIAYWGLDRPFQLSNSAPGIRPCIPSIFLTLQIDD